MFGFSPEVTSWILFALASGCAFMIGKLFSEREVELTVDTTLKYLIHNNMVRWRTDENGEIEILTLDE